MLNFPRMVLRWVGSALFVFAAASPASAAGGKAYTLAVAPSAPPVTLHIQWKPLVDSLSRTTGLSFHLTLYEKMDEFERDIWSGKPDFIFASPIQTVVAHQSNGYQPLLRSSRSIAVGLFVRYDSPFKTLDDLTGKSIAFVGNKNLCSVFILHLLADQKHQFPFAREYAGSSKNVIMNVLLGKSDAGAVYVPELERMPEETQRQLRALVMTPEIASHPLSSHPRVPKTVREAVRKAIFAFAATPDGAKLLQTLPLGDPVSADYARDYKSLEEIDIQGLTNWGN